MPTHIAGHEAGLPGGSRDGGQQGFAGLRRVAAVQQLVRLPVQQRHHLLANLPRAVLDTQLAQVGDLLGEDLDVGHAHPPARRAGGALRRRHGEREQDWFGERGRAHLRLVQQPPQCGVLATITHCPSFPCLAFDWGLEPAVAGIAGGTGHDGMGNSKSREWAMQTQVTEIASGIYRLSTYLDDADFTYNQFVIDAEEHGPAYTWDCAQALRDLAVGYDQRLTADVIPDG